MITLLCYRPAGEGTGGEGAEERGSQSGGDPVHPLPVQHQDRCV